MSYNRNRIKGTFMLMIVLGTTIFTQPLQTIKDIPDGWQRGLEMGAFSATLFTAGCGYALLKRHEGDPEVTKNYQDMGISMKQHRAAHKTGSVMALSLYMASAWQLYKINLNRDHLEFRHKAHNTIFLTTIGGVVSAGIVGALSSNAYRNGHSQLVGDYARLMKQISYSTLAIGFADLILFGRHDNASIIGVKINF